jgi:cell division protease FtsH
MKKPFNFFSPERTKQLLISLIVFSISIAVLYKLTELSRNAVVFSYSTFLDKVEQNLVKRVQISGNNVIGILKNGTTFETVILDDQSLWQTLRKYKVDVIAESVGTDWTLILFISMMVFLVIGVGIWLLMRQARNLGSGGNLFSMGKSKAKMYLPTEIKERFTSVAGALEAKEELVEIVDFLKNPGKYRRLGAKIPRGALLVGEPGNGKTLLARAVAGEANCPFFNIAGSDFIEVFVGIGAARVRDLFSQARKHAPCIIFIDEIDAVGRQRGTGLGGGGNDEREQTLNQLLSEMDGFVQSKSPIIVLAATNRPDVLDKALLRPGRFDRRVIVPFPDLKSREEILALHSKNIKLDDSVDMKKLARGTPGFSGADLANLINEAAVAASGQDKEKVDIADFEKARDKIMLGKELKSIQLTAQDQRLIAYHEAGHALVGVLRPETSDPLHKITIIPRGSALGVTHSLPEREKYIVTKEEIETSVMVTLGGRAAEEIEFGTMTTGAGSDFQASTRMLRNMVSKYGMSDAVGKVIYDTSQQGEFIYSQHAAETIDKEVKRLADYYYEQTKKLIADNKDKLDLLAMKLLEKETLHAGEVYELLGIAPREEHSFK